MVSYYRINVAKDGFYLFATEQGHITTKRELQEVLPVIYEKFPSSEGYNVSCVYWDAKGSEIEIKDLVE